MTNLHSVLRCKLVYPLKNHNVSSILCNAINSSLSQPSNPKNQHFKTRRAPLSSSTSSMTSSIMDENGLLQFKTLHELQKNACVAFAENELFGTFVPSSPKNQKQKQGEQISDGKFEWMTYKEFNKNVNRCRTVLKDHLGIQEYSKIGIISNNRWEWAAVASAAYSLNATLVPMYEAQAPKDWQYILNDSQCSAVFCATTQVYDKVTREVIPSTPSVKHSICFDAELGEEYAFKTHMDQVSFVDDASVITPSPEDLANLIYTSGTTGKPKGVELIHSNTVSNVKGVGTMVEDFRDLIHTNDRSLAFLPWAHSYGQTCELWCFFSGGASMGICRGVPSILEDLQLVKPTTLFSVPTLYKKVYDGVNNMIENSSPLKQKLMKKAFELGEKNNENNLSGFMERAQHKMLDGIVLSKVRDRFGGNLRQGFCAGAAVPGEVLSFMNNIGIPIFEGYGLTETSPIIALNVPGKRKVSKNIF